MPRLLDQPLAILSFKTLTCIVYNGANEENTSVEICFVTTRGSANGVGHFSLNTVSKTLAFLKRALLKKSRAVRNFGKDGVS